MRTSRTTALTLVLTGTVLLSGLVGCGYGPIEQSYALESGAESASFAIGEDTRLPELMAQMRLAQLNLADQLTANSPQQALSAATTVVMLARDMSAFQPAIALGTSADAAQFKRLMHDVQDMAVECAKAADKGQMGLADRYYAHLYLNYNRWRRRHMGVPSAPTEPMEIPERADLPTPVATASADGTTPPATPAPETPAAETSTVAAEPDPDTVKLQNMVKRMRTRLLNLADRLSTGSPQQATQAAVAVSLLAEEISAHKYKVKLADDATEDDKKAAEKEEAVFKQTLLEVQGLAVECAKAADAKQMVAADGYFVRLYITYNQWKRFFAAPAAAVAGDTTDDGDMPIPRIEDGTTPPEGDTPTPAPGGTTPPGGAIPGPPG